MVLSAADPGRIGVAPAHSDHEGLASVGGTLEGHGGCAHRSLLGQGSVEPRLPEDSSGQVVTQGTPPRTGVAGQPAEAWRYHS